MALTYSTAKTALDEIAARIQSNRKRLQQAKANVTASKGDLGNFPTLYGSLVTALNTAAQANPDDSAWQTAKAELDLLVAEFNALQTTATAMEAAIDDHTV